MHKHIVFDFDGTLVQSKQLAVELFNELSQKYGYRKIASEEVEYMASLSIRDRLKALQCPLYKLPSLLREVKKKYKQEVVTLRSVEGMEAAMCSLKVEGCRLGILSSNHSENIQAFLDHNSLTGFDYVYTASNIFGKDRALRKLMRERGISAHELLYIGDELRDIEACKRLQVHCAAVTWGYDAEELLATGAPEYTLRHPEDILLLVNS
ncbi:phosphoglycolate phosphatase [Paenibacillus sambharensis]|uniref:Phosphoglycolate phosphatase n=1 Tax=Paenibacillus sambharensis TaxID=1803190 RepID=A0A2W1LSC5_9BACL|nr:HAD-IA family hydrolase [Paenibacillus sambharensis]PZD94741.1 phosphoglycolate phosphatase [Paenibacillus sambharensis]